MAIAGQTRVIKNTNAEYSMRKFAANTAVASSSTEDVTYGGTLNFLTAATTFRIKAGNVADTAAGAGARTILVSYLDSDWNPQLITLTCNGATAGTTTAVTGARFYRAYVLTTGTYGGSNTGDVVIENGAGTIDLLTIGAGMVHTQPIRECDVAG